MLNAEMDIVGRRLDRIQRDQRGITLVEALITLLVVTIGLLGVAALQMLGVRGETGAMRQSQATWLAYEMADRMRANLNPAALSTEDVSAGPADIADHYDGIDVSAAEPPTGQVCDAANRCNLRQMADYDADQWRSSIIVLPNGRGTVDEDQVGVGGRYRIRVMWDEASPPGAEQGGEAGSPWTGCPTDPSIAQTCVETWIRP